MSPIAQRIALLEFCGWTGITGSKEWIRGWGMEGEDLWCVAGTDKNGERQPLPDPLNDLNALREMAMELSPELRHKYALWLGPLTSERAFSVINASAAQRGEAMLRTIGKWEDDK